jgi:transposase
MKNKATIYGNCNPQLAKIFEAAGHPAKVMCVALDYAKEKHTALMCQGRGQVLQRSFPVENSAEGARTLLDLVGQCAKKHHIDQEHVFFGGEDCPSYAENFVRRLRQHKYLVVGVNAWEAKQQRSNFAASNDSLDLLGVAKCCLNQRGETVEDWPEEYANLRIATRNRHRLVCQRTAISNSIHVYVDRLVPGFLDRAKSGISPFCQASLDLMAERFTPEQLRRRSAKTLAQWLRQRGLEQPQEAAAQLKALAKEALEPAPEQAALLQQSLAQLVQLHQGLTTSIGLMDKEVAFWLARTPGAVLTSIDGIGVTLAALWTAELGPVSQWRPVRCLCSYSGVVPRSKQTGGPDKAPVVGSTHRRCNTRLKNAVLQAVQKVRQHGPVDLRQTAQRLEEQGSHVEFAMAKRLLRLGKWLALNQTAYRPKALMDPDTPKATLASHYEGLWTKLVEKWKDKADLRDVFSAPRPLGQWRKMAQELYALELRLPQVRKAPKSGASTP